MFVLLLALGIALCTGYETDHVNYGDQFKIRVSFRAHTLKFFRDGKLNGTILWSRYDSADTVRRGEKIGSYYIIEKATQRDSGRYEVSDRNGDRVTEKKISVKAIKRTISRTEHEEFRFDFNLKQDSCNIKFKPMSRYIAFDIVSRGRLQRVGDEDYCEELKFWPPCEIYLEEVVKSCDGYFTVYDNDDNTAWEVELNVAAADVDAVDIKSIILSTALPGFIVGCCCCLRRCCCKKSSKKDKPNENEPVLLSRTDLDEHSTPYPAQPNASTGPLIHSPPVNDPPAYSEVPPSADSTYAPTFPPPYAPTVFPSYAPTVPPASAPTVPVSCEPTAPAPTVPVSFTPTVHPPSAPTVPLSCDPTAPPSFAPTVTVSFAPTLPPSSESEPRFELKGFTLSSYSPLSSGSVEVGVYNSDKMNF